MNRSSSTDLRKSQVVGLGVLRKLGRIYLPRRYSILFYVLLFTLVVSPLIAALGLSGAVLESLLAVCLFAAVMPISAEKYGKILLVIIVTVWLARAVTEWLGRQRLSAMSLGLWTVIGLFAAATALRFAMRATKVDAEHLFAALSAYLLAGIYFGLLYWTIEKAYPGMLSASDLSRGGAIYFSFVTLATLGYGDIVPRTDVARGLTILEGVGGQLFLAVLVARLVSLYSKSTED
jgi:voltage-gated potassium channel